MKNDALKLFFGIVILLFSSALGYFTADYLSTNHYFDYWGTIAIFAAAYAVIGMAVSMIFSISLGFLFSADVLILHLLAHYYGDWADAVKFVIVGAILMVLYFAAGISMRDEAQPTQ